MTKARTNYTLALFALAALAGCGSPADNTAFKPPQGWSSTPGVMGRFQMWMSPGSANKQFVMLIRGDQNMTLEGKDQPWNTNTNMRSMKKSSIVICGNQRVDYYEGDGESQSNNGTKRPERVEGVINSIGDSKYMALYVRPKSLGQDPDAEAAIHSLCPAAK